MKKSNKNLLKSILILLAILLAVGAVLVFLKTRVQPPQRLTYVNQFTDNIHQASERIAAADEQGLEKDFQMIIDRVELFKREGLISGEEYTASLSEFVNAYIPAFRNWCEQRFNQPEWPQETLKFMRARIGEVNRFNANSNNSIVSPENKAKLDEVDKVLKDYDAAWKLQNASIHSGSEARSNLAKADQFKRDAHLSKCTAVVNMLNNLPSVYQQRHRNYVASLVNRLNMSNFRYASQLGDWVDKYNMANSAVKDYNSVASTIYHTSGYDDFGLSAKKNNARDGFRQLIKSESDVPESVYQNYERTFNTTISRY